MILDHEGRSHQRILDGWRINRGERLLVQGEMKFLGLAVKIEIIYIPEQPGINPREIGFKGRSE